MQVRPGGPRPGGRRLLSVAATVVSALLLLVAALGGAAYGYLSYRLGQVHKVHVPHLRGSVPVTQPFNVLLVGSDSRSVQGNNASSFGTAQQVPGQRADVIKLVHVDPEHTRVSQLSIPRDLLVPIAGTGRRAKINDALEQGPDALVQTIERQFGVPVDHYVLVTFEGFESVVRALGGVRLDFPAKAYDTYTGLRIEHTGCQHLDAKQALAVARSRHYHYFANGSWHYDPTSDFGRILRQNAFLQAVASKALRTGLTNPVRANAFLGKVVDKLTVDDSWTISDLVGLAVQFRGFHADELRSATLPTQVANHYEGFGDVLLPEPQQDAQAIARWLGRAAPGGSPQPSAPPGSSPPPSGAGPGGGPSAAPSGTGAAPTPSASPSPELPPFDPRPC